MSDSNGSSKTEVISVTDVLKCAKQWIDETANRLLLEHRSHLCERLSTLSTSLAAALYSAPVSRIEYASRSVGGIVYRTGERQATLVRSTMRQRSMFGTQGNLLSSSPFPAYTSRYLKVLEGVSRFGLDDRSLKVIARLGDIEEIDQVSVELSDALLQAGSLLAPAQLQMLRATEGFKDEKTAVDVQRHVITLTAASVEERLWCLCVVPKVLKDEGEIYFPSTAGLSLHNTFAFENDDYRVGEKVFKVTGDIPSSAVLLSSALASLYDAQAALEFGKIALDGKTALDVQGIHGYGRLALALQAAIKLIADIDKSSQPNPLLVPLYLRLLWTSMSLFHNSLDTFLTNKRDGKSVYRVAKLCMMLHAVAEKFLFGKQHGDLDAYVSTAWDALVRQVSTSPSGLPSSAISMLIS